MVNFFLFKLCALTAMSGFLFGYDTGIVSGSMIFIKDEMNLSTVWIEMIVSSTIAFAWFSAWCTVSINDRIGRKTLIIMASALFTLASLIMGLAPDKYALLIGRAVAGCGIGLGSMIAPIYIAELAPKENRGSLVTFNSAFVTFGILASSLIASAFSYLPSDIGWRFMLGFAGVPSLAQMIGFFFMPESPRYLVLKGKEKEALDVMIKICKNDLDKAKEEIRLIKTSFEEHQINSNGNSNNKNGLYDSNNNGFTNIELKKPNETYNLQRKSDNESYITKLVNIFKDKSTRHCLLIGICLHLGQQLSAINTIMYYGAMLIQMSGILSKRVAIWFTVVVGITNATTSFLALFIYDRVTRRKVTLWSMSGIVICLALMGSVFLKVDNSVLEIKDLNDTYTENLESINYCRQIQTCGKCVTDINCGFCFNSADVENTGRCLPRRKDDELKSLNNTYCAAGSDEDLDIYFSTTNCPSDYGVIVLVTLCAFLVSYAPGMGATPWSINAEIYPMWCRGVAVSFATGFNWLFNLLVSISFLTITEYFQVSGAFFLYCGVSAILTVIFYLWLPETKNKTLEQDTLVFHH